MKELTTENFDSEVSQGTTLVELGAPWCKFCVTMEPIVESIGKNLPDIKIAKVNIDNSLELKERYVTNGIPVVLIFKDGELKYQKGGLQFEKDLIPKIVEIKNEKGAIDNYNESIKTSKESIKIGNLVMIGLASLVLFVALKGK